jgi:hypothetical protein
LEAIEDGARMHPAYPSTYDLVETGNRHWPITYLLRHVVCIESVVGIIWI